ncbi:MAG: hypothetical protein J6X37_01405 [Treponema sp.]|nr:hypothetical protein [Treponema sp.]
MTTKELKEIIKEIPDDLEVKMLEEGGYLIDVVDAFVDEDVSNRDVFVISH